ncbi:DNA gyrase subunit A [Candidatus Soleaferrea massiliensis]|uniref:DNA gyrase subunit A n=1 Tax=Candidatus Soleaferrea massiliensis TaxID=1470354 RepID=UPI00058DF6F4|nr:DNA gyrase subunit A [Candidatus Soleaferrea massiliensis]
MDINGTNIIGVDIEKEMKDSYLAYSMSVIVGRALPDVRDGLKPVHRRILYTLYENGLGPEKAYRKSADTVGSVLGRYHPHGDASVYDALVRMAQDFSLRYPLVDGHGNFGSIDGDPPAAYRYTEAKMSKISVSMLTDIEKKTVNFVPNYDDRLQEPAVLPSRFPNLLVNGSTGIAVGMATNIPPHNLREVIDGVCHLIDNPDATLDELMQFIKGPDFPTGGIVMGKAGIRAAYATGRGRITLRARAEIEEDKNNRFKIVVTEIPYMVNKSRLIENIANLVKDKRIEGISDLRDESDREGMRIVIELKRDANPQIVLNHLYTYTQMQETVSAIMLALSDGQPKVMSLKEMLEQYLAFQGEIIVRRTRYDLEKAQERAHILEGLKIALDNLDEVLSILRSSKSIPEGKSALMERFGLSEAQASAIVAMRLGQLTGLERSKIENELAELLSQIEEYKKILSDDHLVMEIVREEISTLRDKYGDERRTEIQAVSGEVDIEDLIPVEDCAITLTHYGYLKRQAVDAYKTQRRGGRGVMGMQRREEDFVEELFISSTHDYVLFFTNRGKVYRLKCYEIPECSRQAKGTNIVNLLPLEPEEKVTSMIKVDKIEDSKYLVMITKNGIIKRTELGAFKSARKNGLIAINLDEGDELVWVRQTEGSADLIIATKNGKAIRFMEESIRPIARTGRGVRAIRLMEGDHVVGMSTVRDNATLLVISEAGLGRRTAPSEIKVQHRGGKGIIIYQTDKKDSFVAGIKIVNDDDDVLMISDDGVIIRIRADEIPVQSRYAGGVKAIRVNEGAKVVTLARAPKEDISDDEGEEDVPAEEVQSQEAPASEKEADNVVSPAITD